MDLQKFLEEGAEKPVFLLASVSMISRAAAYYTGQEQHFQAMLGATGMGWYNGVTGVGLAAGCELLGSIAGRNWRRHLDEAHDAATRKGVSKIERIELTRYFQRKARIDMLFMGIGLAASYIAALNFLWVGNPDHSLGVIVGEVVLTTLLLAVISYLGIFKDGKRHGASEATTARAQLIQQRIVDGAGQRIANGQHTIQDVKLFSRQLPKMDRDRFMAAFAADTPDDPHWTTTDIVNWLDCNTQTGKRQVTRKLARLAEAGAPVMRNDKGAYIVPRSAVFLHFADDFLAMAHGGRSTPSMRTIRRPSGPLTAQDSIGDSDAALTVTGERPAGASVQNVVASVA